MHRDQIIEKARLHRNHNIEYYREYTKHYRETHYLRLKTKARKRIACECGCMIIRNCLSKHRKSEKNLKYEKFELTSLGNNNYSNYLRK